MGHEPASVKRFATSESGERRTRYDRARAEWDDRIGTSRAQAANWRLIALANAAISLTCVIGLIVQSTKASVIPYLVEVEASGQVRLVGEVTTQDWSLSESSKRVELARFIRNLRSISSDGRVLQERFASARDHATPAGNLQIDRLVERDDPFARFGEQVRTVHVESQTVLPGSNQAYRVEWREEVFGPGGREKIGTERYVGEFHLTIIPPSDAQTLEVNPLGVYVSFFDLDRKSSP